MNIEIHIHPVREDDPERLAKLEGALRLTTNSREFNRKRVVELEDEVARLKRDQQESGADLWHGQVELRAERDALKAELERWDKAVGNIDPTWTVEALAENYTRACDALMKVRAEREELETDRDRLMIEAEAKQTWINALENRIVNLDADRQAERDLVQEERTRANNLARRVAELERQRNQYAANMDAQELAYAEEREEHRRSIASRDHLLNAATTRVKAAQRILSAPLIAGTRSEIVTSKGTILSDAIGNALAALDA